MKFCQSKEILNKTNRVIQFDVQRAREKEKEKE